MPWAIADTRHDGHSIASRIFEPLKHMIAVRKTLHPLHAEASSSPIWMHNPSVFGLVRHSPRGRVLVLANFSEQRQNVPGHRLMDAGFGVDLIDHLTGDTHRGYFDLPMQPFQSLWLSVADKPGR